MAGLPVMEGKAILFEEFADVDAFPIYEFINKLHKISGLVQLEEYDEAVKFINVIETS